jgi:hypothetical protein
MLAIASVYCGQITGIKVLISFLQATLPLIVRKLLFHINHVNTPLIREKSEDVLILESIQKRVWNPVFTVGAIAFVISMLIRGFLNAYLAVIPLGLSTIVLICGVWILSANGTVVFDKGDSKVYFIYKHLGYLQKIYVHALTSFESVLLEEVEVSKNRLYLLKDDSSRLKITNANNGLQSELADEISAFLAVPISNK